MISLLLFLAKIVGVIGGVARVLAEVAAGWWAALIDVLRILFGRERR